jgi:uroporphyrinogen III methyltransferase/synthase
MSSVIKIGSRDSKLARVQVDEALPVLKPLFPEGTAFEAVFFQSPGDRDQTTSLTDPSVPDDFFTRDLDAALRDKRIDLTVHSAKDLPKTPVPGLAVAALLPSKDIRDALAVRAGITSDDAIKTIGTSSPKREAELKKLLPGATLKAIRGTIGRRLEQMDAGEYDAVVIAACALERLGLKERISRYLSYDPIPQQGRLAIVVRAEDEELLAHLKKIDVRRTAGLVAIIGCPADADLLPRKAEQYLRHADVVLHDRLLPESVLASIGGKAVNVGKAARKHSVTQPEIHRLLLQEAEQGKLVVRLHGGDPGVYGHLGEELEFLTSWNIRVDVVPAPTAAQVAAAHAHTPLTHRGRGHRVTIVSARPGSESEAIPLPPPGHGNLAIYMGVEEMKFVASQLMDDAWPADTPVICGERLGYRDERITRTTLEHVGQVSIETPAVFLVGTRAFPATPFTLFVGTDPEHFIGQGPLLHWPLIKLAARPLKDRVAQLKTHLDDVRGIIFPSRFAVSCLVEALMHGSDVRALAGKTLLAVGPATADELARFGLRADGAADNLGGVHALAKKLTKDFKGKYLYPCSDASPTAERAAALKDHGIDVVPATFYENHELPRVDLPRLNFSRVLFTSSSTVKAYFKHHPEELKANRTWIAVGPSTLKTLHELGLRAEELG